MTATINASTSSGLIQTADTSGTLALQSNGTTQFTVSSTGAYGQLKSATAQASTSGTSIDFTSIPSWVKRITVMFNGVSLSGTTDYLVRLGTSGGVASSGYSAQWGYINGTNTSATATTNTTGFGVTGVLAANVVSGTMVFSLVDASTNVWVASQTMGNSANAVLIGGGKVTLPATLDRVRITTVNGTDTFDAGSINILYEG